MFKRILTMLILSLSSSSYSQEKKIKLSSENRPPYIGPELKNHGVCAEIVLAAFKEVGYSVQIVFSQWTKALNDAKKGVSDAVFPAYYDSIENGRADDFYFSSDIYYGTLLFLTRSELDIPYIKQKDLNKTYDALTHFKFGVVRNYIGEKIFTLRSYEHSNQFSSYGKDLEVEYSSNQEINMQKLFEKKVDLILIDRRAAKYLIDKNYPDKKNAFKFLEPEFVKNNAYMLFSKKLKESKTRLNDFNRGLKKIKENGIYDKIIKNNQYLQRYN